MHMAFKPKMDCHSSNFPSTIFFKIAATYAPIMGWNPARKPVWGILILLIAFASCSSPKAIEYRDFSNFKIEKLGFQTSRVKMDLSYFNPNNFGLQLKQTEVSIFINGTYLGGATQEYQISIPKKSDFTIPLAIDLEMKNLLKNSWNSLMNKEVTVKVTGKIKVGKANMFIAYPVNYEGKHRFSVF